MTRRPPISKRTDTLFPHTPLFRSLPRAPAVRLRDPQPRLAVAVQPQAGPDLVHPVAAARRRAEHPPLAGPHRPGEQRAAEVDNQVPALPGRLAPQRPPLRLPRPLAPGDDTPDARHTRLEERGGGKECVSTGRSRSSPYH